MTPSILEAVAQEDRWRRFREGLRLVDPCVEDFATGGLGADVRDLRVRMIALPSDPMAASIDFDDEFWDWFGSLQSTPWPEQTFDWGRPQPTPFGAVLADRTGRGPWECDQYLALHRSGAVEFGTGRRCGGTRYDRPEFFLIAIVGRVWLALDALRQVRERYDASGPTEVSVALRNTEGSALGHFAEGWRDPFPDGERCNQPVLLYTERTTAVQDADCCLALACRVGAWIENCYGSRGRRFLAGAGDHAGEFDYRRLYR